MLWALFSKVETAVTTELKISGHSVYCCFLVMLTVLGLWRLAVGLSPRRTGLCTTQVRVGFVMNELAPRNLRSSFVSCIPPVIYCHLFIMTLQKLTINGVAKHRAELLPLVFSFHKIQKRSTLSSKQRKTQRLSWALCSVGTICCVELWSLTDFWGQPNDSNFENFLGLFDPWRWYL